MAAIVREFGIAIDTPCTVTMPNEIMCRHDKDTVERFSRHLTPYKRFIGYMSSMLVSLKDTLFHFLDALDDNADHINFCVSDSNSSILDLFLCRDTAANVLK